uniref:G-patch_2 domain-containing protein n=1 Tax=Steinernema glaseri TaxID=37863 RepID=A0A1I7Z7X6_9BILA
MVPENSASSEQQVNRHKQRRDKPRNKFHHTTAEAQEGYIGDQAIEKILSALGEESDYHNKNKKKAKKGRKKSGGEISSPGSSNNSKFGDSGRKPEKYGSPSSSDKKDNVLSPEEVDAMEVTEDVTAIENVMRLKLPSGREISLPAGGPQPNETQTDLEDQEFREMELVMQRAWDEYSSGAKPIRYEVATV